MIRLLFDILMVLIFFLLQQSTFQALSLGGIVPNLLLILCAVYGMVSGKREGMWVGFFSGLLIDVFYGDLIGINMLIYMAIGFYNGYFKGGFFQEDIKMPIFYISVSSILYSVVYYITNFLLRGRNSIFIYLKDVVVPEFFYTIIIAFLIYKPLLFLLKLTDNQGEEI